jgi:hypothetical protein
MSKISDLVKQPTCVYNGHNIQSATVDQTLRPNLNFSGFNISDDPTNGRTNIGFPSSGTQVCASTYAKVYTTTASTIANDSDLIVVFNSVGLDSGGLFSLTDKGFKIKNAGFYKIKFQFAWASGSANDANVETMGSILKNGTCVSYYRENATAVGWNGRYCRTEEPRVWLNTNDIITFVTRHWDNGNSRTLTIDTNTYNTWASIEQLDTLTLTSTSPSIAFSANKPTGSDQSGMTGSWVQTKVTFQTEEFDTNNNYDPSTSRFTPTVSGKYLIKATVNCSTALTAADALFCSVYKNGASAKMGEISTGNSTGWTSAEISLIIDMNGTTDYVEIYASKIGAGTWTLYGGVNYTYFQASLLSTNTTHAGYLLSPNVGFSAHKGIVAQNIPGSIQTKVDFGTIEYDTNSNYNISTSRFTPTVTGRYNVISSLVFDSHLDQAAIILMIYKNGIVYKEGSYVRESGTGSVGAYVSAIVDMNGSTDYLEIYVYSEGAKATRGDARQCYFQSSLLAATAVYAKNMLTPNVGFSANKTVAQTGIAQNIITKVTFPTELYDTNSNYDTTNSIFTPTVAGKYLINASIYVSTSSDGSAHSITIYKNGVSYRTILERTAYNSISVHISDIVDMNGTTDYLEIYTTSTNTTSIQLDTGNFQAQLLSATTAYSGYNMAPSVSFSVNKGGINQTFTGGSPSTKVTFPVKEFDTNNNFDTTLSRFTPTVAGKYTITATMYFNSVSTYNYSVQLYKNGILFSYGDATYNSPGGLNNTIVDMNGTTDYLEVYAYSSNSGSVIIDGTTTSTRFQASLLSTSTDIGTLVKENSQLVSGNNVLVAHNNESATRTLTTATVADTDIIQSFVVPVSGMYLVRFSAGYITTTTTTVFTFYVVIDGVSVANCIGDVYTSNERPNLSLEKMVYISKGSHTIKVQVGTLTNGTLTFTYGQTCLTVTNPNNQYNVLQLPDYKNNSRLVKEIVLSTAGTTMTFDGLDGLADGGYDLEVVAQNATGTAAAISIYFNGDTSVANYRFADIYSSVGTSAGSTVGATGSSICAIDKTGTYVVSSYARSSINMVNGYVSYVSSASEDFRNTTGPNFYTDNFSGKYIVPVSNISTITLICAQNMAAGSIARLYRKGTAQSEPQKVIYTGVPTAGSLVKEVTVTTATSSVLFSNLNGLVDGGYILEISGSSSSSSVFTTMFVNGDSEPTHYRVARHFTDGSSPTAQPLNSPAIGILDVSPYISNIRGDISFTSGKVVAFYSNSRGASSTVVELDTFAYQYPTSITNITSLSIQHSGTISVGTVLRLYRKIPQVVYPPSVITTQKVYEKTITLSSAMSTVTFDGLDGVTDGGYTLECNIVNPTTNKMVNLFCNKDFAITSSYSAHYNMWVNGIPSAGSAASYNPWIGNAMGSTKTLLAVNITHTFEVISFESGIDPITAENSRLGMYSVKKNTAPTNIYCLDVKCEDTTAIFGVGSTFTLRGKKTRTDVIAIPSLTNIVDQRVITSPTSIVSFPNLNILRDGRYRLEAEIYNNSGADGILYPSVNGDYGYALNGNYKRMYTGSSSSGTADNSGVGFSVINSSTVKATTFFDIVAGRIHMMCEFIYVLGNGNVQWYNQSGYYIPTVTNLSQIDLKSATSCICTGSKVTLYKDNYDVPATSPYDVVSAGKLTDLVKEIVLQSPSSQVDFDGLDINRDGEYELSYQIIGANGATTHQIFANNDIVETNYYTQVTIATGNGTTSMGRWNNACICNTINTNGKANIQISNGIIIVAGNSTQGTSALPQSFRFDTTYNIAQSNVTKLSIKPTSSNGIAAGSTFRLYRKKANNVLALTSRYLNNLVEEKVLTMDSSSVTFTGLDSLVDGDYYLEHISKAGNTSGSVILCYINNDQTSGRYTSQYTSASGAVMSCGTGSLTGIELGFLDSSTGNNTNSGTLLIKRINGSTSFHSNLLNLRASTFYNQTFCGYYNQDVAINSLVLSSGTNLFKEGSKFTLYKSNGAKKLVPYDPTDISSRTSDYPLRAGEVVYLNYTNATSVPLHIATEEGEYEMSILGDSSVAYVNGNNLQLSPNNTATDTAPNNPTYPTVKNLLNYGNGATPGSAFTTTDTTHFVLNFALSVQTKSRISTAIKSKSLLSEGFCATGATTYQSQSINSLWINTITPWTSLGTITFPFAQSGKIIIKRII